MIPLILLNYEKILHTANITTYQKTLYADGNSKIINQLSVQKFFVLKKKLKETF